MRSHARDSLRAYMRTVQNYPASPKATISEEQKMLNRIAILAAVVCLTAGAALAQQDKSKRPSPPAKTECKFTDGKSITVDYSSPRMKGRKIYGDLVPNGQVWRAGANEATSLVTDAALTVGGKEVPAGSYTLFAIPNADKWTLIISKKTGIWGTDYPGPAEDLARVDMKVSALPAPVENFTIAFDNAGNTCTLRMDWETTRASVPVLRKM